MSETSGQSEVVSSAASRIPSSLLFAVYFLRWSCVRVAKTYGSETSRELIASAAVIHGILNYLAILQVCCHIYEHITLCPAL